MSPPARKLLLLAWAMRYEWITGIMAGFFIVAGHSSREFWAGVACVALFLVLPLFRQSMFENALHKAGLVATKQTSPAPAATGQDGAK